MYSSSDELSAAGGTPQGGSARKRGARASEPRTPARAPGAAARQPWRGARVQGFGVGRGAPTLVYPRQTGLNATASPFVPGSASKEAPAEPSAAAVAAADARYEEEA